MAKPTSREALEGAGFKLRDSQFNGSGDRSGVAMTHHYTATTPSAAGLITHHVFVDEYGNNPGKYNVTYHLQKRGQPHADGLYDTVRRHADNSRGGVKDPLAEVMQHHRNVLGALTTEKAPTLVDINHKNMDRIMPDYRYGDKPPITSLNSVRYSSFVRECPECGERDDIDFIEHYAPDERGLHSIPTGKYYGQCNNCYSEFEPKEKLSPDAAEWNPSLEREASMNKTAARLMDQADRDLRP